MNIYTSENEMLKEELKAANAWIKASEKIIAEQDAKLKLALYRAVKTYHEGKPVYVAQQEPPKYRRGSRVICLETEEYCVIHISGTDRQWIKFPDSHIGVYTNEQVAELFELLPKEQPQQEPVAWRTFDGEGGYEYRAYEMNEQYAQEWEQRNPKHKDWVEPLYTSPPQRTWVGLTDEEALDCWPGRAMYADCVKFWENIEAKLKEKNEH